MTFLKTVKSMALFSLPMIIGQIGQIAIQLSDNIMVGQLGVTPLASIAFGSAIVNVLLIFGLGFGASIHVLVSQSLGAKRNKDANTYFKHGLFLCLSYGTLAGLFFQSFPQILNLFGQKAEVVEGARLYTPITVWSLVFAFGMQAFKNFCECHRRPWLPFWILNSCVVLNIFLNWLLIFGNWGFPRMEIRGAAIATLIARILAFFILATWVLNTRSFQLNKFALLPKGLKTRKLFFVFTVGMPISLQILFEWGVFICGTIMMGWIGESSLAANQVVFQYAAFCFMIPLGISFATTVQVGRESGAKNWKGVWNVAHSGILLAGTFMLFCGIFAFFCGPLIARIFIKNTEVILLATLFLRFCGSGQIGDGIQIVTLAALRGLHDIRIPTILAFSAYMLVALSIAYWLAFHWKLGGVGIWIGLITGLMSAAIVFYCRFRIIFKKLSTSHV